MFEIHSSHNTRWCQVLSHRSEVEITKRYLLRCPTKAQFYIDADTDSTRHRKHSIDTDIHCILIRENINLLRCVVLTDPSRMDNSLSSCYQRPHVALCTVTHFVRCSVRSGALHNFLCSMNLLPTLCVMCSDAC